MNTEHGIFTVSLDLELYWGVRDKRSIDEYKTNLQGARKAIPEILKVFTKGGIHATWAALGLLFFHDLQELQQNIPKLLPSYDNDNFSPYKYIIQAQTLENQYHFAPDIISLIASHDGQEIATHTFSHYYPMEKGQNIAEFEEDIRCAIETASRKGISVKSIIFPRHQWSSEHLEVLKKLGILCFRGNQSGWIYRATEEKQRHKIKRIAHVLDAYFSLSGHNTYTAKSCFQKKPYNFPASLFLRPYSKKLAPLNGLKSRRIKKAMKYAAVNKRIFHLWWHPHNFGSHTDQNMDFLRNVIDYYMSLKEKYGMTSLNMAELCALSENR